MPHFQRLILTACASLALAFNAASAAEVAGAASQATANPLVQIEVGDQVKVDVFGNPELAGLADVADDGSIRLPLVGSIPVRGLSLTEAGRKIEAALKSGQFLVDPHVTVSIAQAFRQFVTVMGEVGTQGRYPIQAHSTVLDVIALAGGVSAKGADSVYILRKDAAGVLQRTEVKLDMRDIVTAGNASAAALQVLQGGDSILVPKGTFTITGNVTTPGEYRVESGMLLFQAIARAGGVTPLGSDRRVEIRRLGPNDKYVDIKGKKDTRIEAGDVIKVKERVF